MQTNMVGYRPVARGLGLVLSIVLGLSGLRPAQAAPPTTTDNEQAKRHYEAGSRAFALGDFTKAVEEYKAGFNLKSDPVFLYNIAQSYRLGGDLKQALFFYQSYLNNAPRAPNRREVEDRIAKLETQIAEQRAATPPPVAPAPKPVEPAPVVVTPAPAAATLTTSAPPVEKKPVYKKWWLWTTVGAVVVVGVGLGVGLGLGLQPKAPSTTLGTTEVF